jgi:hypothetical protein
MVGELIKKAVNLVVVVLAAITFFLVPLGTKTTFQHLCAIFSTQEAGELGKELERTGKTVVEEVEKQVVPAPHPSTSVAKKTTPGS